ncbi:MAG: helicase HerA-like domain-containing protein, partial [Massilia sp.]
VVRLIRSKGVGVFFITQNPLDIPDTVLGQLGNRVQHALRAYTPRDQKAVKAAAETFRPNPALDTAQVITELGVGEALVSFLDEKGRPNMVERAFILPPASQIGPIDAAARKAAIASSVVAGIYEKTVDRESAYEMIQRRVDAGAAPAPTPVPAPSGGSGSRSAPASVPQTGDSDGGGLGGMLGSIFGGTNKRESPVEAMMKSAARSIGSQVGREIIRGVLGSILKRR